MATFTAQTIITRVQTVLQESGAGTRWTTPELLRWISDGQREIAALRPDSTNTRAPLALVAGARQQLPAAAVSMIDIPRNLGLDGNTPGRAIRQAKRELLDAVFPAWSTDPASTVVRHFMYDPRLPREFFVYPPSTGTNFIELRYETNPVDVTADTDTLSIGDEYANPLVDYTLCRCYTKDADAVGNADRAVLHRSAFEKTLGLKAQADAGTTAKA